MALTLNLAASPVAHKIARIELQDVYHQERSISIPVAPATTLVQVTTLAAALEVASYAKLCEVWLDNLLYIPTGGKAGAELGSFDSVKEYLNVFMSDNANCKIATRFLIAAPQAAMLYGTEKRLGDINDPLLAAVVAAWQAVFVNVSDGTLGTAYSFDHATRGSSRLTTPNVF